MHDYQNIDWNYMLKVHNSIIQFKVGCCYNMFFVSGNRAKLDLYVLFPCKSIHNNIEFDNLGCRYIARQN